MRKFYLLDTSAAKYFYLPPEGNVKTTLAFLAAQRLAKECILYIPTFCIAELFNVLACYYYRDKAITKREYEDHIRVAQQHVRAPTRFLYPLELTRHHNYRMDSIFPIEHGKFTEYDAAGVKAPALADDVDRALKEKNPGDRAAKYHLSAVDMLIIAMGMELAEVHGQENVAIITNDKRLARIALECKAIGAPVAYYAINIPTKEMERFHAS